MPPVLLNGQIVRAQVLPRQRAHQDPPESREGAARYLPVHVAGSHVTPDLTSIPVTAPPARYSTLRRITREDCRALADTEMRGPLRRLRSDPISLFLVAVSQRSSLAWISHSTFAGLRRIGDFARARQVFPDNGPIGGSPHTRGYARQPATQMDFPFPPRPQREPRAGSET